MCIVSFGLKEEREEEEEEEEEKERKKERKKDLGKRKERNRPFAFPNC